MRAITGLGTARNHPCRIYLYARHPGVSMTRIWNLRARACKRYIFVACRARSSAESMSFSTSSATSGSARFTGFARSDTR
jgi:hypothetical protein